MARKIEEIIAALEHEYALGRESAYYGDKYDYRKAELLVDKLATIGEQEIPKLLAKLNHSDYLVREAIFSALVIIGKPAIPYVFKIFENDNNNLEAYRTLFGFANLKKENAQFVLAEALKSRIKNSLKKDLIKRCEVILKMPPGKEIPKKEWTWNHQSGKNWRSHEGVHTYERCITWFKDGYPGWTAASASQQSFEDFLKDGPSVSGAPQKVIDQIYELLGKKRKKK